MKKHLIINFVLIFISFSVYAQQINNLPKGAKAGDLYCYNYKTVKWTKVNADLAKIVKEGKLKALQYKLKNLNYDVDITNCIDDKTTKAFEEEKRRLRNVKKDKRKLDRLQRKEKRLKRKKENKQKAKIK